ncbi:MAG: DUF58 domain-containing protein [Actinobacteria bacterium]|jgi:uncharacterized protein (DUF58 family)|nr:DUF58 domain-containing protein [Actinomycetota bacterium]
MPRPTGRGYALIALAVATYVAGRVVGTWELYLIAFALLVAVVLSWLLVILTGRRIRVSRSLSVERPVAGDEPGFVLLVENASLLPGPRLALRSSLEDMSAGRIEAELESLAPRGSKTLTRQTGRVNRGVHALPAVEAQVEDPLGVATAVHKVGAPLVVTVLPRIEFLGSCVLYPDIGLKHDWSGRRGLQSIGATEFRGIRPHQPGEPLSHIDWKSTAKTSVLMLRETEEPAGADVTILLDGTASRLVGEAPNSNFELAVRIAGSIADFVLRSGRGIRLVSHERNRRETRLTADGGGRRALLQTLAEARPDAPDPLVGSLRRLRSDGPRLLTTHSVTIVSLSLDQALTNTIMQLHDDGAHPALIYVDGASFADATAEVGSTLLLSLSSARIPCLTLGSGDDIVHTLSLWRAGHREETGAR